MTKRVQCSACHGSRRVWDRWIRGFNECGCYRGTVVAEEE